MIPETTVLVRLHEIMDDLASKYGGQYDGWEAEIADDSNDVA